MERSKKQWTFLILLGVPALGITLAYTFVTMYLPVFIERSSGAAVTGLMIGGEGIFAICIPFIVGAWSDSINKRVGRLPFIFAGTLIFIVTLVLMPLSKNYLAILAFELAFFFIAYYTYLAAYYALYPDFIPNEQSGRSQGVQGGFRAVGMLLALAGGGYLLHFSEILPFIIALFVIVIGTSILYFTIRDKIRVNKNNVLKIKKEWLSQWKLLRTNKQIRLWFISNSFWECSISGLKVFIVLYFIKGLNLTLIQSSNILSLVGLAAIFAAPLAGKLADRYGHRIVIIISLLLFAAGLTPPLFLLNPYLIAAIMPFALAAIVLTTLPYSLLMGYLPKDQYHGAGAALFLFCQGIGAIVGPLTVGLTIESVKNLHFLSFSETHGYVAVFLVSAVYLLLSLPSTILLFKKDR